MITCKEFPKRTFATKQDLFKELVSSEKELIGLKKSNILKGYEKYSLSFLNVDKFLNGTQKSNLGFDTKKGFIYPVISTTRYKDSHDDVHLDGCFGKTVKEQQGKVYYALDHELKYNSILAWQKDVNMIIADIPWAAVGKNFEGSTQALVFEIAENKIRNKEVLEDIKNSVSDFENSIRMQYHDVFLAIDSQEKGMEEYKSRFDEIIETIANKAETKELGYFWGVRQLGIHKEGSLVVAGGSNDATTIIMNQSEPDDHSETDKNEPSADTQEAQKLLSLIKF